VSGERIVANGVPSIEGLGQDGDRSRFWWSVEHDQRVQRTVVGTRRNGSLLLAVFAPTRSGVRDGVTTLDSARWLVARGVTDAIALDGGQQAGMYIAGRGEALGLQKGEPRLQIALLIGGGADATAHAVSQVVGLPSATDRTIIPLPNTGRDPLRDAVDPAVQAGRLRMVPRPGLDMRDGLAVAADLIGVLTLLIIGWLKFDGGHRRRRL
jgi:hypothetical protein